MSTSLRDILFRRQRREPMDERLPNGMTPDEIVRQQQRPQMDYRYGVDDVTVLPSGKIEPRSNPLEQPLPSAKQQAITRPRSFKDALQQRVVHPPLGAQPPRPAGIPANAHWDATGIGPDGGEWIGAAPNQQPTQEPMPTQMGDAVRPRRTEPRDYIADDEAYLRDLEKNKGPFWKRLAAAAIRGTQAATHSDISPILTSREQEIADVTNRLGRGLTVAQKRQQIEAGSMVPVELEDGSTVMAPARSAGTLRSNQQRIRQTAKTNADRVQHWNSMEKRDRTRSIISLYNSGALNDPQLLEYAADELGLPGTMREKFIAGRMRGAIGEDGTLLNVNAQTGTAAPVLNQQGQPQKSIQGTLEQGRNRRAAEAQAGQNQRAAMRGTNGPRGTPVDKTALRRAAQLTGVIEQTRKELEAFDSRQPGQRTPEIEKRRKAIADKAAGAMTELNNLGAGYEAGMGEGGYPYFKQQGSQQATQAQSAQGQFTGKRISKANVAEYGRRHSMTPEQAAKFLIDGGAVIY